MNKVLSPGMRRLNYLISETNAAYHEAAMKLGLSDSAMMILYTICNSGGDCCLLSDICKLSGASKQTINSALRKLEAEGVLYLVMINRRKKKVCLTERGKDMVQKKVVPLIEIENSILSSWTQEEQEQYLGQMQRYLDAFRDLIESV